MSMRIIRSLQIFVVVALGLAAVPAAAGEPRSLIGSLPSIGSSTAKLGQSVSNSMHGMATFKPIPVTTGNHAMPAASAPSATQARNSDILGDVPADVSPYVGQERDPQVRRLLTRAEHLFAAQRYEDVAELLKDPRIADHAHAQFLEGVLYEYGLGVTRDDAQAAVHYEAAASKGHAAAQYSLGLMYSDGRGVDRMPDRALLWIELAANQGLPDAQYALGLRYYNGAGTKPDFVIALKWFEVAAGYGHKSSADNIASLARTMSKDDVVKARQLAAIWKPSVRKVPVQ